MVAKAKGGKGTAATRAKRANGKSKQPLDKTLEGKQSAAPEKEAPAAKIDPAMLEQISAIRTKVHETFGKVALAMMSLPRYRHQTLGDLNHLLLNPLVRDRIAIASSKPEKGSEIDTLSGIAIWASVSAEVDEKIREQIKSGVFPVRLQAEDWTSGDINWLFDVIAPDQRLTTAVIANFRQVIKEGEMRIHPLVSRLVDPEVLKKMGAAPIKSDNANKT